MVEKIILAKPRGFCFGVRKAISKVENAIRDEDASPKNPIYIKHEIVHNKHITKRLEEKGAITKNSLVDIPDSSTVVFSAHGSLVEEYEIARDKNCKVIDATCPLVKKVHDRAIDLTSKGYKIIYIGKKGHMEANGVLSEAPSKMFLISGIDDIDSIPFQKDEQIAVLTQTTLNVNKTKDVLEELNKRFSKLLVEKKEDICYATTNRQEAVERVAGDADLMIIVGSKNSSNTKRLYNISKNISRFSYMIDDISELNESWFDDDSIKIVGISSGASVPDDLVLEVVEWFKEKGAKVIEE